MKTIHFKLIGYLIVLMGFCNAFAQSYDEFFSAIQRDDASTVAQLLQRGFDVNSRDVQGRPGLYAALQDESYRAATALLGSPKIDVNALNASDESPLMMAALKGQLDWCQRLVQRGARLDKTGWSPLHYAAAAPSDEVVAWMIQQGADLNAASPNRTTPLMMAASYGSEASVQRLLASGADAARRNDRGLTVVDFARQAGRDALAAQLQNRPR